MYRYFFESGKIVLEMGKNDKNMHSSTSELLGEKKVIFHAWTFFVDFKQTLGILCLPNFKISFG